MLAFVVHFFAIFMLYQSGLAIALKIIFFILLAIQFSTLFVNPYPYGQSNGIRLGKHYLFLMYSDQEIAYEKISILVNAGFVYVFRLTIEQENKFLIIFRDQLSAAELRLLKLRT